MENRKLKQKRKDRSKKPNLITSCFMCIASDEIEEVESGLLDVVSIQPTPNLTTKHEVSVCYQTSASYYSPKSELTLPSISPNNILLSQAYSKKFQDLSENDKKISSTPSLVDEKAIIEREHKDELIKTILGRYLAVKREEFLYKDPPTQKENSKDSLFKKQNDVLKVECFSSGSSETLMLEETTEDSKPKIEFPEKTKSAPTTSAAHDSLADICSKMNRFKQQENKPYDSYSNSYSDETINTKSNRNTKTKKKLELIFNNSSEEHVSSCHEDNSAGSLSYQISCEKSPVSTGSLRTDSILTRNQRNYDRTKKYMRLTSQELHIQPSAKGEIGGINGSTSSLKWKLIISHHGHGDVH